RRSRVDGGLDPPVGAAGTNPEIASGPAAGGGHDPQPGGKSQAHTPHPSSSHGTLLPPCRPRGRAASWVLGEGGGPALQVPSLSVGSGRAAGEWDRIRWHATAARRP